MTTQQYPPVWRRFAAMIYDSLLVIAISMGYAAVCIGIGVGLLGNEEALTSGIFFQLGWAATIIAFFCFFWMKSGQTLGMRAWRLCVIQAEQGNFPRLLPCLKRCILAPIGLSLFIVALLRKDKQCLHDLWSHTEVVLLEKEK